MPAYATQTAPKQTQNSQQQPKKQKPEAPKGLAALPQSAGIAALVVMVALALPIGNFRALQNATPQAFIRQGDVKSIVEGRISAAQNAVTVAQRSSVSQTTLEDVNNAIKAMQSAKTAATSAVRISSSPWPSASWWTTRTSPAPKMKRCSPARRTPLPSRAVSSVRRRAPTTRKPKRPKSSMKNCRPDSCCLSRTCTREFK